MTFDIFYFNVTVIIDVLHSKAFHHTDGDDEHGHDEALIRSFDSVNAAGKRPKVAVNISQDVLGIVMEFLPPKQLYQMALTCKGLRAAVTTRCVREKSSFSLSSWHPLMLFFSHSL
jgi:hypothetical protein